MHVLRKDSTGETELAGTTRDLLRVVDALRSGGRTLQLDSSVDPAPYGRALSLLVSRRTSGGVTMSVAPEGTSIEIQGGVEELAILASNIEGFASEGDPAIHLHIEYFPGHVYLSEGSEPLVVTLQSE